MISKILGSLALLSAGFALQASTMVTERFDIPFAFQVRHRTLPSGAYQVQQESGSSLAILVNVGTGARVQFVRAAGMRSKGKARLVFENRNNVQSLREID